MHGSCFVLFFILFCFVPFRFVFTISCIVVVFVFVFSFALFCSISLFHNIMYGSCFCFFVCFRFVLFHFVLFSQYHVW